jgi:preprotein translocase subunit SecD
VSPKSGGRAQRRHRRLLVTSVLIVLGITLASFAAVFAAQWSPRLGLDLAGGVSVVYTAEGNHISTADMNETVNILNLRVNGLGVSGATVQTTGTNQISVSIPGVTNAQQVLNEIGQTARLYFRPVECYAYPESVPKHAPKNYTPPRGIGTVPPCQSSYAITTSSLNVTPDPSSPNGFTSNNVPPDPQYVLG